MSLSFYLYAGNLCSCCTVSIWYVCGVSRKQFSKESFQWCWIMPGDYFLDNVIRHLTDSCTSATFMLYLTSLQGLFKVNNTVAIFQMKLLPVYGHVAWVGMAYFIENWGVYKIQLYFLTDIFISIVSFLSIWWWKMYSQLLWRSFLFSTRFCLILVGEWDYMVLKTLMGKANMILPVPSIPGGTCWDVLVSPWSSVMARCRLLHAGCPITTS